MKAPSVSVVLLCAGNPVERDLRLRIRTAMLQVQLLPNWKEYIKGKGNAPFPILEDQVYPAIFINGQMIWNASHQRLPPTSSEIAFRLTHPPKKRSLMIKNLHHHLSFLTAVFIAFFPKCPFCWAAYMSLFAGLGLGNISYQPWLLPFFIGLLFLNLGSLFLSRKRHGLGPLLLSLIGAFLITMNRLYFESQTTLLLGAVLLVIPSFWNSLPRRILRSLRYYIIPFHLRKRVS